MILAVMNAIYAIAYIESWKIQDFNGVWTRDLATLVRRSAVETETNSYYEQFDFFGIFSTGNRINLPL